MSFALVSALLITRLVLIACIWQITGGREFTDDADMHIEMALQPFYQFQAELEYHRQHPPLLGLLTSCFYLPFKQLVSSDFIAIRLSYMAFEVLSLMVLLKASKQKSPHFKALLAAIFILNPLNWMTSVIMPQDELVSLLFASVAVYLLCIKQWHYSVMVCGIGVVAAKIFFLIPAAAIITLAPKRLKLGVYFALPIALCYIALYACHAINGGYADAAAFSPRIVHGINAWVAIVDWQLLNKEQAKWLSSGLSLIALSAFTLTTLFSRQKLSLKKLNLKQLKNHYRNNHNSPTTREALLLISGCFWLFILLFYHITSEYFMLLLPFALLACQGVNQLSRTGLGLCILGSAGYAINLFHGVYWAELKQTPGIKQMFVEAYYQFTALSPLLMKYLTIGLCCALMLYLLLQTAVRLRLASAHAKGACE